MHKKIFLIINTYFSYVGGAEVIAYNTYKLLKTLNYDVYFWSCDKQPYREPEYKYEKYFTKYNPSILNYFKWYYNIEAKRDLGEFIKEIKPDIIHLHGFISYLSPAILECCKDIPTVATLHDAAIICPAVKLLYKNKTLCDKLLCQKGNYYNCFLNQCSDGGIEANIRKSIRAYITYKNLKYIDKFITPSEAIRKKVLEADIGIKENDIVKVNNFLVSDKQAVPSYQNKLYFLYVGRLSQEKGLDCLLHTFKELPGNIELHILGTGPMEAYVSDFIKKHKMLNVKLLGYKSGIELEEEYRNCISIIVPSNCFEIFGLIVIEAAIQGKPTIASNIGALSEVVDNNQTGLLFEPNNSEQLKQCILKYWSNSSLVIEHGKNAFNKAKQKYMSEAYVSELLKIYDSISVD